MFTSSPYDFKRDRWGRPDIIREDGSHEWFTRMTTVAGTVADRFAIEKWGKRMVLFGAALRPDVVAGASAFHEDPTQMDKLVVEAESAAAISASATVGSAKHELSAQVHLGQIELDSITPLLHDDIAAIIAAEREHFAEVLGVEFHIVNDDLEAAGTADRLYRLHDGRCCIGDLKTGANAMKYASQEIAVQLAGYSHGLRYDPRTGERTPFPEGFTPDIGYVVHAPTGEPVRVYEFNLKRGWAGAALAFHVRQYRKEEVARALTTPAGNAF
jgi:hypothetical protein